MSGEAEGEGRGSWWCRWYVRLAAVLLLLGSVEIGRELLWTIEAPVEQLEPNISVPMASVDTDRNVTVLREEFHAERKSSADEREREAWGESEGSALLETAREAPAEPPVEQLATLAPLGSSLTMDQRVSESSLSEEINAEPALAVEEEEREGRGGRGEQHLVAQHVEQLDFGIFEPVGSVDTERNVTLLWEEFHAERMPPLEERETWGEGEGELGGRKVAYAFYITDERYACAARVLVRQLRAYGSRAAYLVVHMRGKLSRKTVQLMAEEAIDVREVEGLPFAQGPAYYRDVLVKLRVFEQFDYDRLVFMDADTFALASLDDLFHLRLEGDEKIAAPWNYYDETAPFVKIMPWLMVIEPTEELWQKMEAKYLSVAGMKRIKAKLGHAFDGEVINLEFQGDRSLKLPPQYAVLNSEWCHNPDGRTTRVYHFFEERDVGHHALEGLVHFSCWQKPWWHRDEDVDLNVQLDTFLKDIYHAWYVMARDIGCYAPKIGEDEETEGA